MVDSMKFHHKLKYDEPANYVKDLKLEHDSNNTFLLGLIVDFPSQSKMFLLLVNFTT